MFEHCVAEGAERRENWGFKMFNRVVLTNQHIYCINNVFFSLLSKRLRSFMKEVPKVLPKTRHILITWVIRRIQTETRVQWLDGGNHFGNFISDLSSINIQYYRQGETYNISLVSAALATSSGRMWYFISVGMPEKALRTRLKCLSLGSALGTHFSEYIQLPAEVVSPSRVSLDTLWDTKIQQRRSQWQT